METIRAIVPSFCAGLTSFPPRHQVKDPHRHERLLEKKTGFQLSFHIVSVLKLGICNKKDRKRVGRGKVLIFALIIEKLKFRKYREIAFGVELFQGL